MTIKLEIKGQDVVIRSLVRSDVPAVGQFAAALSTHDLLFLRRDIQHARVIDAWMQAADRGEMESLVAVCDDRVVATLAVAREKLGWSPHVAEIRMVVAAELRGGGLGRQLLAKGIELAIEGGASKLTARMTPDQTGAITLFEEAGFRGEALLRDHVRDRDGNAHDLAVLALHPGRAAGRRAGFGENGYADK